MSNHSFLLHEIFLNQKTFSFIRITHSLILAGNIYQAVVGQCKIAHVSGVTYWVKIAHVSGVTYWVKIAHVSGVTYWVKIAHVSGVTYWVKIAHVSGVTYWVKIAHVSGVTYWVKMVVQLLLIDSVFLC